MTSQGITISGDTTTKTHIQNWTLKHIEQHWTLNIEQHWKTTTLENIEH